ncbi:MAG: AGE family epimerase/isomerase, partial [Bacteroidia bacterium]|nr:AGE family epimerase/isomerase [Bacteroidia bacterium]
FSSVFNILKDFSYLKIATRAKDYILDHFIDKKYGGCYYSLYPSGEPADLRKQIYTQSFFIYSLAEYYIATGDKTALSAAKKVFQLVEKYGYDRENNGYFEAYNRDWKRINDKMIGEKTDNDKKGMNTHIHLLEAYTNLYHAWPSVKVEDRLRNLIEILTRKLLDTKSNHLIIFLDEKWNSTSTIYSFGHDIEASWLILEAAKSIGDTTLINCIKKIRIKRAIAALEGLQSDGSIIYEKNYITGELNTSRQWWPQAETVLGSLNMYDLTDDQLYLDIAKKCWEFIKQNLVDNQNGEWWGSITTSGSRGRGDKAGFWKCPYHNSRMCTEIIKKYSSLK